MLNDTSAWLETEFLNINVESLNVRYKTEHEVYRYCVDLFVTGEAVLLGLPSTEVDLQALLKVSHDNMSVKCFHSTSLVWYILQLYSTCCSFYKIVPVQIWNVKCDIFFICNVWHNLAEAEQATEHNIWCRFPGAGGEKSIRHPFYCDEMSDRNRKTGHYDQSKLTEELHNTPSYDRIFVQYQVHEKRKKKPKFWAAIFSSFWVFFVLIILYIYFGVWYTIS